MRSERGCTHLPTAGHFLSPSITRLDLIRDESVLANATGFFLLYQDRWYLVTNWHVLSGRNPDSGRPLHPGGVVPTGVRFFRCLLTEKGLSWEGIISALGDAATGTATWLQHPTLGPKVDVAVLPLAPEHVGKAKNILDPGGHDPDMWIDLGEDLFLPGYPLGLSANGLFAVWKRASLASSLEYGEGITTRFLVDTATREGMSGSPCFAIPRGPYYALDRVTTKMRRIDEPLHWRWMGVYSGRMNPSDNFEAQLGVVWRENLVIETIEGEQRAQVRVVAG